MGKTIFLAIMFTVTITVKGQYYILPSKVVLPSLILEDELLKEQLDSILFVKHPCEQSTYKIERQYTYFVWIKETTCKNYTINIVYAKPSDVESDINTGIYNMNDVIMIIRENSIIPLFKPTGDKESFSYNKELMSRDGNKLTEIITPEEFCIWGLYYSDNKLNILDLEQVKNVSSTWQY